MRMRWTEVEPSLDELLGDEIMDRVTRSDGVSVDALRRDLAELAVRLRRRDASRDRACV